MIYRISLTVTLLPASTGTSTTELLRLHPSWVCDQEGTVVCHQLLLQLHGAVCVDVLGVVSDDGTRNSLTHSVDLRSVSTTLHPNADVDGGEGVLAGDKDRLVDLVAQDLRADEVDGRAIDADETTALLGVCYRGSGLFLTERLNGFGG